MLCSVLLAVLASQAFVFAEDDSTEALTFLSQYHYISPTRSGRYDVETAIRKFQQFTGLPVTGKLDAATFAQFKRPRCGLPDLDDEVPMMRFKRYYTVRSKWSKTHLTYFVEHGADLPHSTQDDVFAKAAKFWSDASGLTFSKASSADAADIKISFGKGTHAGPNEKSCVLTFKGREVLGHAYFPSDGRIHLNEAQRFTDGTRRGINLLWLAAHEFGHTLGIHHTNIRDAVMYPYFKGYEKSLSLHQDDIAAIQSLYGKPSAGGGEAESCQDISIRNCPHLAPYCESNSNVQAMCKKTCNRC